MNRSETEEMHSRLMRRIEGIDDSICEIINSDLYGFVKKLVYADDYMYSPEFDYLDMCSEIFEMTDEVWPLEEEIPDSLRLIVEAENRLIKTGKISDITDENSPTAMWLKLFANVGADAVSCDNKIEVEEIECFRKSLSDFLRYIIATLNQPYFHSRTVLKYFKFYIITYEISNC